MTRLEKYLVATASEIIDAETTESRYFVIGNVKLRVSDHHSKMSDADIQVIIPHNGGSKYLVTVKGSEGRFLVWNAKQIQEFVPAFQVLKGLKTPVMTTTHKSETKLPAVNKIHLAMSQPELENTPDLVIKGMVKTRLKQKELGAAGRVVLVKSKSTWNKSEIGTLSQMIRKDLGLKDACSINEDIQIFLTCTSITYEEMLNIYKIVVVDSKLTPTIRLLQKAYTLISTSVE